MRSGALQCPKANIPWMRSSAPGLAADASHNLGLIHNPKRFNVAITRKGQTFKLRLPFPRPATDRKDVKALIVEMTQASAGAA